jgi:levanase/fructan beta-fructosidase
MKKRSLLTLMTVMLTCMVVAQVKPIVLGDKHAMLKIEQGSRYLLLPVQESEDIAAIAVLDNHNNMVQRINVKLAIERVDYYVPYELKGACLMDIEFRGDRRQKGAVGDFVCWKDMKYSNSFDTTNREKFRPAYHHTPLYGWMNDPNGMFYKDGVWHLYFQYNPYGSQWENMTWGHSTSRDLIHWETQPLAIEADWLGSIFSGSCVTNGNDVVAFYTSAGHHQTQSMAVSKDGGRTFEKFDGNPILSTSEIPDFRDPKAFWNEDAKVWNLILAAGQEMRIYSSKDLKDWKYESSFGKEYGNHSGVWECPDLFKLRMENGELREGKWVLICNINPGGPFGGSATQYFIGQFDGKKFTCESMPKVTKWMDYGKDHYATVSFYNAPENRRVVLAWMSNWQYANQVPTKQYRSANSIPRDLGLFQYGEETYMSVVPSKEMLALRGEKVKKPTETCEIVVDLKNQAEIVLSNTKGEEVTMRYDAQKQTFTMDRTKSGDVSFSEAFPCETTAPTYGHIKQLRIFIDRCSIEAFDADGKIAMTNLVFPSEPYNMIKVKGGKATIYEVNSEK